jgi:hypothetical protein
VKLALRVAALLLALTVGMGWAPGVAGPEAPSRSARTRTVGLDAARLALRQSQAPSPSHYRRSAGSQQAKLAPVPEAGFTAIAGGGQIAPSDTTGAAGVTHALTAVNIEYALYLKAAATSPPGPGTALQAGTLESLFPGLPGGTFVFDPKVVYDPYRGQFVLAFLAAHGPPFGPGQKRSWILVVTVPDATANDPNTWCRRRFQGDQIGKNGVQFADYPGLGLDAKRVYITTNQFGFTGAEEFEYAQILVLWKSSLYQCGQKVRREVFARGATRDPTKTPAFTIQPAITQGGTGKTPEFLISFQDRSCGNFCGRRLTVWRIKKRPGKGLTLAKDAVEVGRTRTAPLGTQKDGSATCSPVHHCWDVGDLRLVTSFYDAGLGRLYTAHAVRLDVAPGDGYLEAVARWYEIDPSPIGKSKVTRRGDLGTSGRDGGWPSVVTDGAGTLFVNYSRAGAPASGEYLSAVAATIPPGATVPDAETVLYPGEALYVQDVGQPQRWGDFSAANRDPVDPLDVWLVNQFAKADTDGPPSPLWQQSVHRVSSA